MTTFLQAQKWIIWASLLSSGCLIAFFLLGPPLNFPLEISQARHLLQLVLPPFFGYLALAVRITVSHGGEGNGAPLPDLLPLLLRGTMLLYSAIIVIALVGFYLANSPSTAPHSGGYWPFEGLSWAICVALSLQASTVTALVSFLFGRTAKDLALSKGNPS